MVNQIKYKDTIYDVLDTISISNVNYFNIVSKDESANQKIMLLEELKKGNQKFYLLPKYLDYQKKDLILDQELIIDSLLNSLKNGIDQGIINSDSMQNKTNQIREFISNYLSSQNIELSNSEFNKRKSRIIDGIILKNDDDFMIDPSTVYHDNQIEEKVVLTSPESDLEKKKKEYEPVIFDIGSLDPNYIPEFLIKNEGRLTPSQVIVLQGIVEQKKASKPSTNINQNGITNNKIKSLKKDNKRAAFADVLILCLITEAFGLGSILYIIINSMK